MKNKLLIGALMACVLAFALPSCQSDGGQILEQAARDTANALVETEKRIEDRIAAILAKMQAGEMTADEVKDGTRAIVREEKAAVKDTVDDIVARAKDALRAERDSWGGRLTDGIGGAIGTYGSSGSIWLALGTLVSSIFYTRNRTAMAKLEIDRERDAKYKPGGPFAQPVQPGQQQFQPYPTQPMMQPPPQVVYVQTPAPQQRRQSAPIVPLDPEVQA